MVFGLFKKIMSLVLSRICVKWKFSWFINILRKLYAWEKMALGNEISVVFNCQYFIIRLISDFDFWHVDRSEQGCLFLVWMKGTRLINRVSDKNSHMGKWAILGPKMAHPHNSGSSVRNFLKFCTMKGANR